MKSNKTNIKNTVQYCFQQIYYININLYNIKVFQFQKVKLKKTIPTKQDKQEKSYFKISKKQFYGKNGKKWQL